MGDARRNDNGGIVRSAVVVAVDKKPHCPRRQTGARLAQNHLGPTLHEKHHVPLLVFIGTKRKILRFIDEKTPEAYGVDASPRLEVLKTGEPAGRKAGVKVKTVGELVDKLKNEMGLI